MSDHEPVDWVYLERHLVTFLRNQGYHEAADDLEGSGVVEGFGKSAMGYAERDENSNRMRSPPTEQKDLDATHLLGLSDVEVGDEVWIPVSFMRGNRFRAAKVEVKERVSANGYEEMHAVEKWSDGEGTTIHGPAEAHKQSGHDSK